MSRAAVSRRCEPAPAQTRCARAAPGRPARPRRGSRRRRRGTMQDSIHRAARNMRHRGHTLSLDPRQHLRDRSLNLVRGRRERRLRSFQVLSHRPSPRASEPSPAAAWSWDTRASPQDNRARRDSGACDTRREQVGVVVQDTGDRRLRHTGGASDVRARQHRALRASAHIAADRLPLAHATIVSTKR